MAVEIEILLEMLVWSGGFRIFVILMPFLSFSGIAQGQQIYISASENAIQLGRLVSPSSGTTIVRLAADTGVVQTVSGTGGPVGSISNGRALVTVSCTGGAVEDCPSRMALVTVRSFGESYSNRLGALTNFTVAAGPNPPTISSVSGTNPLTFAVSGIPRDGSRNFYVGADLPIKSSGATGYSYSEFEVGVEAWHQARFYATILMPLIVSSSGSLSFGKVTGITGDTTISVDANTGAASVTGPGRLVANIPASRILFNLSGEGGQIFGITLPSQIIMTSGAGDQLTVNLSQSVIPANRTFAYDNTASIGVGGNVTVSTTTPKGSYVGNFTLTIQYQ